MKAPQRLKTAVQKLPGSQKLGIEARKNVRRAKVRVAKVKRSLDEKLLESAKLQEVNKVLKDKLHKIEKDKEFATALAFQVLERAKDIRNKLPHTIKSKVTEIKSDLKSNE